MPDRSPTSSYSRPDRSNLKTIVAFVDPDKAYNVKSAAMRTGSTVQKIADLAITEWLERFEAKDPKTMANLRAAVGERAAPGPEINPLAQEAKPA